MAAVLGALLAAGAVVGAEAVPEREQELVRLVRQDCGACHGMTLQGGLGTPLTAEALRDKPVDSLAATILGGRPGTAMPPWKPFMSEQEARWLVELLQAGQRP